MMIKHINNVSFRGTASLSSFNIWVMNHQRTHSHVRSHGTRPFFALLYIYTRAKKETVAHTLLKNSCTCVGVSRMREQLGIQIERRKELRSSGTTTFGNLVWSLKAMRDIWK